MQGDRERGHGRACGSAEHPGLKRGSFLTRSVSRFFCSQERRSPGWLWKEPSLGDDPSRILRSAHRVGCGKNRLSAMIRLGPGHIFFILRRGARRVGCGKNRLLAMIRLGWNRSRGLLASELQRLFRLSYGSLLHLDLFPGEAVTERSVSKISCSQERRSPGWRWKDPSWGFLIPRRGARRAGGGKIRLENFLFPGEALTGLEAERSVSKISRSQERRSPGWRRKDPSRKFLVPRRGARRAGGGKIRSFKERRSLGWRWNPNTVGGRRSEAYSILMISFFGRKTMQNSQILHPAERKLLKNGKLPEFPKSSFFSCQTTSEVPQPLDLLGFGRKHPMQQLGLGTESALV